MRRVLLLAPLLLLPTGADARPADGDAVVATLADDLAAGRIDHETWLLESFRYGFAPERSAERYVPAERTLLRCGTPLVREYVAERDRLSASTRAEIDGYLTRPTDLGRAVYVSPSGHFTLTYSTSGTHAVPTTDVNPANGVPDFVERCAEYMDTSWATEIDGLGFTAPFVSGGSYAVGFENMGFYGYTSPVGATTEIVLHRNFIGFPSNTDPDGNQLGAAKVTCAHEFKHASQYTNNFWSEGGWVELDATWMEDIVYPNTNDYWNYVNNNGPNVLGQPWTPLDNGGSGSYEDCLWEHYLSNAHGNAIMVEVYDQLAAHPGWTMQRAYQEAQSVFGTSWEESYPRFLEWAWFTGSRAEAGLGFPDAPTLKRMNVRATVSAYPYTRSTTVNQLAGDPYWFNPPTSPVGSPVVTFDGDDALDKFTVSVLMKDGTGAITIAQPALAAGNTFAYTVPFAWTNLTYVGVIVTNSKRSGGLVPYSLVVTDEAASTDAPALGELANTLTLGAPSPNPTRGATRLDCTLPRASHLTVRVLDLAGRTGWDRCSVSPQRLALLPQLTIRENILVPAWVAGGDAGARLDELAHAL
ncbi:MAG: hypothetical protein KC591_07235, partial [Gemmatimonadetes bacterium]|nr:hypothetical protein [Gemmatimonadota bacterium]